MAAKLRLWLELRALCLLGHRRDAVVHLHIIQTIEASHLIVMLTVEQWRCARLEARLCLSVVLLGCVVRVLRLLLDCLCGA